ncbi:MAG: DUF3050 domain-containing protein [Lacibacter sp.]
MHQELLLKTIAPVREQIIHHPLYPQLQTPADLQVFARYHVFAVWDFMSLLKSLQRNLTCVEVPWVPRGSAATRYLINEIVTGEESDVDADGNRVSHFELYLQAMEAMGADATPVQQLLLHLQNGVPVQQALQQLQLPEAVQQFCGFTFELVQQAPVHVQAAVFTFGREDLIPDMFHELVVRLSEAYPRQLSTFRYYLERHIEVDGDHHSQLALQMVQELCGNDAARWQEAATYSKRALELRKQLWDAVLHELQQAGRTVKPQVL